MTVSTEKPSRRAALGAIASLTALAVPAAAIAASPTDGDAEIIALSEEILRINALVQEVNAIRVEPFEERFDQILHGGQSPRDELLEAIDRRIAALRSEPTAASETGSLHGSNHSR
jgi:hypothetical protein